MVITVQELKAMKASGQDFVLIDVREPHEYAEFNLGGALIPLGSVPDHVEKIAAYEGRPIVIHCRSGMRSARAQEFLMAQGITNISNLQGGVLAWIEAFGNEGL
jgi:rhodanese-related sulfurtransferase